MDLKKKKMNEIHSLIYLLKNPNINHKLNLCISLKAVDSAYLQIQLFVSSLPLVLNCSVERTQSCFPHINETGSLSVCAAQRFRRPRYRRGSRPHPQLRQHQDHFQVRAARNYLFTYLFIFHSVSVRSADLKNVNHNKS